LNSRLIVVLLAAIVLSTTYAAAAPVKVPYAEIDSVGSKDPYVVIGEPFEINVVGCVAAFSNSYYGFYIDHTAGYVAWPPGLIPGDKSTILYGSIWKRESVHCISNTGETERCDCNEGLLTNAEVFSDAWHSKHPPPARVNVTLYELGHVGLRLVVVAGTLEGTWQKIEQGQPVSLLTALTYRDFEVNVVKSLPDVKISDVQYVTPTDSIARGETTPVVVKVKYDFPEDMTLHFEIKDQDTGSVVGSWDAPHKLSGEGVFTSSPIEITHPVNRAGDWNLRVKASAESVLSPGLTAKDSKDITIQVASETLPACSVNITKVEHVRSQDTIALGEKTPVTVTAEYRDLLPRSRLLLTFKDVDTGEEITSPLESEALPATGTFVFSPVNLKATKAGDWHLQAVVKVNANCESVATKRFTIKVVEPQDSAQAQITNAQYVPPSETISVAESTPVVFDVNYQNLVPGSKLKMYIIDKATNQNLASKNSIVLSGSGTYTFPPMAIQPLSHGDWHLRAEVRLEGNTLGWLEFTIKVV
jgi:hypothetical protein